MSFRVLGLSGSLRAGSFNTRLLRSAGESLPDSMTFDVFDFSNVPLYNADLEADAPPPSVTDFRAAIAAADAVLIATPEYNYSVPGVLKNAIDWASRPAYRSVLRELPVGVISASPGALGGARAQMHLKSVLHAAGAHVMPAPDLAVGSAESRLSSPHEVDETTAKHIAAWTARFAAWAAAQPARAR